MNQPRSPRPRLTPVAKKPACHLFLLRTLRKTNNAKPVENNEDRIDRIKLKSPYGEIRPPGESMVIVLQQFSPEQEVERETILRAVFRIVKVNVAVSVPEPVHNGPMHASHQEVHREQQIHPPSRREIAVEQNVYRHEQPPDGPAIR